MIKTRAIISANLDSFKEFEYYFSIIGIAEDSINEKPDVTIDCCKSLIEGVSKSILIRLDNNYAENNELVDRPRAIKLFNKSIKLIAKFDKSLVGKETDFLQKSKELVDTIITIRNDRGEISHGKFTPKPDEIISTSEFAVFVLNLTDSIVSFMLKILFQIDIPSSNRLDYEKDEMTTYNDWLDDNTEFPIKRAKYSQLLYENDYDEYESRYSDEFLKIDDEDEIIEETQIETPTQIVTTTTISTTPVLVKLLVNTFDSKILEDETIVELIDEFAEKENLKPKELKTIIEKYLFTEKIPLRDEVVKIMNEKPKLNERAKKTDSLIKRMIEFAKELEKIN
jgi:hypothetical protein